MARYKPRHRKRVVIARGKRVLGVGRRSTVVRVKLTRLDQMNARRCEVAEAYRAGLEDVH